MSLLKYLLILITVDSKIKVNIKYISSRNDFIYLFGIILLV